MPQAPRSSFKPDHWQRVYSQPEPTRAQVIFRRVTGAVQDCVSQVSSPGDAWLDLGCGTGELSRRLVSDGLVVTCIDSDAAMLSWQKRHSSNSNQATMAVASADRLPLPGDSMNGIAAASLTGCLAEHRTFCREVSRVLKPEGYAVISYTNRQSVMLKLATAWRNLFPLKDSSHPFKGSYNRYVLADVIKEYGANKLKPVTVRHLNCLWPGCDRFLSSQHVATARERLSPMLLKRYLCRNFIVVCKKMNA